MKYAMTGAAALLMTTVAAQAGGIERYNQGLAPLFEKGNYVELGFGHVRPTISGKDRAPAALGGPYNTGDVAGSYNQVGLAYKHQFNEQLSGLLMVNEPFGADIRYPLATAGGSPLLGGTAAEVNSTHVTGVLRYVMPNNFGVHAGVNISRADADVTLAGLAYGGLSGYNVKLDSNTAAGFIIGASWEKPEIAARVALTYHSGIKHKFDTVETIGGGPVPTGASDPTEVRTPKSLTLDFQTGVAADTLVFGSVRWVDWSSFRVSPDFFDLAVNPAAAGDSLTDLDDSTTYTLGVGRKINDQFSASASVSWEKKGDNLVSPLAPSNGRVGLTLAGIYTMDNMKITTGINYTKLGDASPETGEVARADMSGSKAIGVGVRVGFSF